MVHVGWSCGRLTHASRPKGPGVVLPAPPLEPAAAGGGQGLPWSPPSRARIGDSTTQSGVPRIPAGIPDATEANKEVYGVDIEANARRLYGAVYGSG